MTNQPIAYLVITPKGEVIRYIDALTNERAQEHLGEVERKEYWPANLDVVVLAPKNGHSVGLDPNWKATTVVRSRLRPDDFVAGTVIVAGAPDANQELTGLTVKDEETVRRMVERG